ncbi:hypothetical protein BU15DRAFT_68764 [Melanogaster broomeanus]|nr:hypothetical protein BU15DRAFT_68764 [Melanogaster broomeanus]
MYHAYELEEMRRLRLTDHIVIASETKPKQKSGPGFCNNRCAAGKRGRVPPPGLPVIQCNQILRVERRDLAPKVLLPTGLRRRQSCSIPHLATMSVWISTGQNVVTSLPSRLRQGAPAILLGILLNTLDAVSTGLLVFPTTQGDSGFSNLQVQAMSLYLARTGVIVCDADYVHSTITSQITLTVWRIAVPSKDSVTINPNLLPTVVAAYTLTSFITGAIHTPGGLACPRHNHCHIFCANSDKNAWFGMVYFTVS